MKIRIISIIVLIGSFLGLQGQNKQILYDFNEIPQSLLTNPGIDVDYKWYAGIPLLSAPYFQFGSSGISVHDIFANDGIPIDDKIRTKAIDGMSKRDELSGFFQIEFINVGFKSKKNPNNFYSFGMYLEGNAIGYWFKDLANLAYYGNAGQLNRKFRLDHLKTTGELVNTFHFGVNKRINKKFTIGARAKLYSSIFNFRSTKNSGFFVTREGENNILANTLVADMEFRTSGLVGIKDIVGDDAVSNSNLTSLLLKRAFFGGSIGVGADFGFTYRLNERTRVTGSVLDFGFIYQNDDVRGFTLKGASTVEGVEITESIRISNIDSDYWQDIIDDVEEQIPFEDANENYLTLRPIKVNGSIRHDFGKELEPKEDCACGVNTTSKLRATRYANSVGGQLYFITRPRGLQAAITAFYQKRFNNLALKATYTADKFTKTNIGLGMVFQAGPVNFYIMADNLLAYQNIADTNYASFQLGLNIISWGKN